jgi:hypothetical protein
MLILTDEQQVTLSVAFETAAGNKANVDGVPVWSSSNPDVVAVTPADDGLSATAVAVGPLGTAQVIVEADADLGAGARSITGTLDIEVRAAEAVAVAIAAGVPELKSTTPPMPA